MKIRRLIPGCLLLLALLPAPAPAQLARAVVEQPAFEKLARGDGYTIRRYPACVVAQVTIPAGTPEAMNRGFSPLAEYIFGNNTAQSKIAMTSPVVQEAAPAERVAMTSPVLQESASAEDPATGDQVVQFVMPAKYTLETLPTPKDPQVTLTTREAQTYAVTKFSWRGLEKHFRKKEAALRKALERDGITVTGSPVYARFDPPWSLPIFRRNEVMIPIDYPAEAPAP